MCFLYMLKPCPPHIGFVWASVMLLLYKMIQNPSVRSHVKRKAQVQIPELFESVAQATGSVVSAAVKRAKKSIFYLCLS